MASTVLSGILLDDHQAQRAAAVPPVEVGPLPDDDALTPPEAAPEVGPGGARAGPSRIQRRPGGARGGPSRAKGRSSGIQAGSSGTQVGVSHTQAGPSGAQGEASGSQRRPSGTQPVEAQVGPAIPPREAQAGPPEDRPLVRADLARRYAEHVALRRLTWSQTTRRRTSGRIWRPEELAVADLLLSLGIEASHSDVARGLADYEVDWASISRDPDNPTTEPRTTGALVMQMKNMDKKLFTGSR